MEKQNVIGNDSKRILIVDSLRGFSLLGILLAHMAVLFYAHDESLLSEHPSTINNIILTINGYLFSGKFFLIFSFLFGLSFFIQMDNASKKGIDYQWRFLWRLLVLLFIGFIHGLLFSGDILIIYAILGALLVLFYKVKDWIIIALIATLVTNAPKILVLEIIHANTTTTAVLPQKNADVKTKDDHDVYRSKSLPEVVKFNLTDKLISKIKSQFSSGGRALPTFAMFLLGLLMGRRRYFEKIEEKIVLIKRLLIWSIILALIFRAIIIGFTLLITNGGSKLTTQLQGTFKGLYNISVALFLTTAFILLYQKFKGKGFFARIIPYGRMGLTNYIMQSIIAIPLLYGFGFGLATRINLAIGVGIGIVIYIIQIKYSNLWLSYFKYGPFEWFWRSLTWLKWQPILKLNKSL